MDFCIPDSLALALELDADREGPGGRRPRDPFLICAKKGFQMREAEYFSASYNIRIMFSTRKK